jgi:hypothetical protein
MFQHYRITGEYFGLESSLAKPHAGFFAGFSTRTDFVGLPLFVQAELLGEQTVVRSERARLRLRALTFPALAGARIEAGDAAVRLAAGPVLGLMSDSINDAEDSLDAGLLFRRPAVSWAVGAGAEFWGWNLDVRYTLYPGRNQVDIPSGGSRNTVEVGKGKALSIAVSYMF